MGAKIYPGLPTIQNANSQKRFCEAFFLLIIVTSPYNFRQVFLRMQASAEYRT